MTYVSTFAYLIYVSWHTMIRDIGKSSFGQIITNSERQIIRENTFIIIKNFYNKKLFSIPNDSILNVTYLLILINCKLHSNYYILKFLEKFGANFV